MLAPLMRHRPGATAISAAAIVQMVLCACSVTLMECPLPRTLGIPCPSCGMTRACVALLRGSSQWIHFHALAPLVLVGVALLLLAVVLPAPARLALADRVEMLERRTAAPMLALAALLLYWVIRLIYAPSALAVLHH
jgi:hypothetical protein